MCSYMKFGPVVQQEIPFKDISYLELWLPFVRWAGTICATLEEGIMRNQWFRKCLLKTVLIWSPDVQRSRIIFAILVEGIKRNNSVKLF